MFEKRDNRFNTKGIGTKVAKEIQVFCWGLTDNLVKEKALKVDYL